MLFYFFQLSPVRQEKYRIRTGINGFFDQTDLEVQNRMKKFVFLMQFIWISVHFKMNRANSNSQALLMNNECWLFATM